MDSKEQEEAGRRRGRRHTEVDVVALEMVHGTLGEHSIILKLRLAQRRGVRRNQYKLRLAGAQGAHRRLEAESVLTRPHDQVETRVDVVGCLFLCLHHDGVGRLGKSVQMLRWTETEFRFRDEEGAVQTQILESLKGKLDVV